MKEIVVSHDEILTWLPHRTEESHKYTNGILLAVIGSRSYPGAAILSTQAATQVGVGGVKAFIPKSLWSLLAIAVPEAMPVELPETSSGAVFSIPEALLNSTLAYSRALLIGCGMGRDPETVVSIKSLLSTIKLPVVIDADGLYALSQIPQMEYAVLSQGRWLLTPHAGELKKLMPDLPIEKTAQLEFVRKKAIDWECTFLLKGFPSVVIGPDGKSFVCEKGSPAATTAGCGDVLAGACAGYLAQGVLPYQAALLGSWEVGMATDSIIAATGRHSVTAHAIVHRLGQRQF